MYPGDINSSMCLSIEKKEEILLLKYPKIVYVISEIDNTIAQHVINMNDAMPGINPKEIHSNLNNKFDKRNKIATKQEVTSEVKKNKVKFTKKLRSKINLNKDELFLDKNNNEVLNDGSLDVSVIKKPKYTKYKKKDKLKNHPHQYDLDSDSIKNLHNQDYKKSVTIDNPLTIQELAGKLKIPEAEIITWLFLKGISVTINQVVDIAVINEVALHYNFNVIDSTSSDQLISNIKPAYISDDSTNNIKRPPIITILGHVDHGKTTLLDRIKSTNLVLEEAGGITQTITGYEVVWSYGSSMKKIVFLDTPGHEAFLSMRLRGAQVTDIALLIVAADDGLQPQTVEAIKHIKNNQLSCIVAINKIDKDDTNINRIREELSKYDLIDQDWGGDTPIVEISALKGENIDILLSKICTIAELKEFKANPYQFAQGTILEAYLDKAKGPIANLLIQDGTLKIGDLIVSQGIYGKVKAIMSSSYIKLLEAGPSSIVKVCGFSIVPQAGVRYQVVKDEKQAKQLISKNSKNSNDYDFSKILNSRITLDTYNKTLNIKQLNLILKADTQGSIEAIINSFSHIPQEKVQINIISAGLGNISDTDLDLALTSSSLIIAFNVSILFNIYNAAEKSQITLNHFDIIYDLIDYIKSYMLDLIEPEYEKKLIGTATVQTVFYINKGSVAGCLVNAGKLKKDSSISVYRKDNLIHNGVLNSLKRIKDDVDEVNTGNECGLMCNDYKLWQRQDIIEAYELKEKTKVL